MRKYSILTAVVSVPQSVPGQLTPVVVLLPDNAIPLQVDYNSGLPGEVATCAIHHLVPCDDEGNLIDEVVSPNVYETAWNELYKLFAERSEQDNLDLMDKAIKGVIEEEKEEVEMRMESEGGVSKEAE